MGRQQEADNANRQRRCTTIYILRLKRCVRVSAMAYYREQLAHCYRQVGFFLRETGSPRERENTSAPRSAPLAKLAATNPTSLKPAHFGRTHLQLGSVLAAEKRYDAQSLSAPRRVHA